MNDFIQEMNEGETLAAKKITTGVSGLDSILDGGLPANHVYLIEGNPGTGKTTLALQFLREGARCGEAGLYVTLSETKKELENVARSHGWSSDSFEIYELTLASDNLKSESQYTIFYPSEIELSETIGEVLAEVERIQPKRVVFDSLSEMRLLAQDPLRYRRQILALKQFFAQRDCTVLLLDDKTYSSISWQIHSIVHGVISLEQLAIEYGAERRRLQVTKLRGSHFRGGYHDLIIETGGIKIFPRLIAAEHTKSFAAEVLESGVKQLDALLGGGLDRGTSSLFTGPTGSGKSTLAAQFAISAATNKQKSSIFIFDETRENYVKRGAGIGLKIEQYLAEGLVTLQQVDPAELTPGEFVNIVIDSVKKLEARVVIIDSLNGYFNAMPEERFLKIQMHELLTYLNKQGVITILVVGEQGFLGDIMQTPVDVSYLADTVLMLRYFESSGVIRRAVSIVKKRTGAHENTIRELQMSSDGIFVGDSLTEFQGVLSGIPTFVGDNKTLTTKINE